MPFRIHKNLRLSIEVACEEQDLRKASDAEVAEILRGCERCGDAMRSINRRGNVIWKATQQLLDELASAEAEADADDAEM
jgi:hypothetical protein